MPDDKPTVFISYSHKDEVWKDRLLPHLRVLEHEGILEEWDDRRIGAGDDWYPEIERAMARASVAILLISADFLSSSFILEEEVPRRWSGDDGLSSRNWTSIIQKPDGKFIRKQCRHCLQPACVSACITGALSKVPSGPVTYDSSKCIGCRYCMIACPFQIPAYEYNRPLLPRVRK